MFDMIKNLKFPLVTRKKLEMQIKNNKELNKQRIATNESNIKLQKELNEKKAMIEDLERYKHDYAKIIEEVTNRCAKISGEKSDLELRLSNSKKTNKELKQSIKKLNDELVRLSEELEKRNQKLKDVAVSKQCKKCGRFFRVSGENANRVHCDKCIEKMKKRNEV
jgi:chromosome segregation ATPase